MFRNADDCSPYFASIVSASSSRPFNELNADIANIRRLNCLRLVGSAWRAALRLCLEWAKDSDLRDSAEVATNVRRSNRKCFGIFIELPQLPAGDAASDRWNSHSKTAPVGIPTAPEEDGHQMADGSHGSAPPRRRPFDNRF